MAKEEDARSHAEAQSDATQTTDKK